MVTSTSTPGSMVMEEICLTTSGELKRSITHWFLFQKTIVKSLSNVKNLKQWAYSHVLRSKCNKHMHINIPSPQGALRVVILRTLVGILTCPFVLSLLSLAPRTKSAHTNNTFRPKSSICNQFFFFLFNPFVINSNKATNLTSLASLHKPSFQPLLLLLQVTESYKFNLLLGVKS